MLPRSRRLRSAEVRTVTTQGKSARAGCLSAKYLIGEEISRVAVVVSRKLAKTAVRRNALRRMLYTELRAAPIPQGLYVVFFLQSIPDKPQVLSKDLHTLCSKLSS